MADTEIDSDLLDLLDQASQAETVPIPAPQATLTPLEDSSDSVDDFFNNMGVKQQSVVPKISKPWMKHHQFVLVQNIQHVNSIIDDAIANGRCSLDLETEGFDNRIQYDAEGRPYTVHKIVGFCLSIGDAKVGYYIPIRHRPDDGGEDLNVQPVEQVEAAIKRLCLAAQPTPKPGQTDLLSFREFETPPRVVIDFWNAKFDQEFLYPITGIDWWHPESFHDGYLACFVLYSDDKNLGLKHKSKQLLKDPDGNPYEMIEMKELFVKGRKIQFYMLSPDEEGVKNYGCSDGVCTRLLCEHPGIIPKVMSKPEWAFTYRLEKQVAQVVRTLERNRVKVDKVQIKKLLDENEEKRLDLRKKIIDLAASKGFTSFEPNSPKQLGEFLFSERGLNIEPKPDKNEKSGQYKTDGDTLETMVKENPNAPEILTWVVTLRGYEKLQGTYLEGLYLNPDANSELRFDFKQTGTTTGRFSAPGREVEHGFSGIPIHGIPGTSAVRTAFVAREGYTMVKADYAGQELRIAANVSNEPVWVNEFLHGTGDLHSITARAFFGKAEVTKEERKMGKIANFALIYGGGPAAIIRATGCDKMEAHRRKAAFDKAVPVFAKWVDGQHKKVKKDLGIWNSFGRWIAIPDANIKEGGTTHSGHRVTGQEANAIKAACERHSTNYPIQSAGADIMKISMVLLHKEFHKRGWLRFGGNDSVRMLLTVHDEIVFEIKHELVPEALKVIVTQMALPGKMPRPPHSPIWKIELIVEPLIGTSWGGEYDYGKMMHGEVKPYEPKYDDHGNELPEKLKYYEIRVGDKIYHRAPPWLEGILIPGYLQQPDAAPQTPPEASGATKQEPSPPVTAEAPQTLVGAPQAPVDDPPPVGEAQPQEVAVEPPKAESPPPSTPTSPPPSEKKNLRIRISVLTPRSVRHVRSILTMYPDPAGVLVHAYDEYGDKTLIDPSMGIRIKPSKVSKVLEMLREASLTAGKPDLA